MDQSPHWQPAVQVRERLPPGGGEQASFWVSPGWHPVSPTQPLHEQPGPQAWDPVPQLPQLCVSPSVHSPWPVQLPQSPQAQLEVQVRVSVPHRVQGLVSGSFGVQSPSPVQFPQPGHWQFAQVRECVPQLPQTSSWVWPFWHAPSFPQLLQLPQAQAAVHERSRVPQSCPQGSLCGAPFGSHSPWPLQFPKPPHSQSAPQTRSWLPQLPHV